MCPISYQFLQLLQKNFFFNLHLRLYFFPIYQMVFNLIRPTLMLPPFFSGSLFMILQSQIRDFLHHSGTWVSPCLLSLSSWIIVGGLYPGIIRPSEKSDELAWRLVSLRASTGLASHDSNKMASGGFGVMPRSPLARLPSNRSTEGELRGKPGELGQTQSWFVPCFGRACGWRAVACRYGAHRKHDIVRY